MHTILQTGQRRCYDGSGRAIPCEGSGQDGEYESGIPWPEPRFTTSGQTVVDRLTGLTWSKNANPGGFPCTWQEALEQIREFNRQWWCGHSDWRLPNRRELRSLMDYQARKPALPEDHPFTDVFLGWYWSSTSAAINPAYAWYVHMEGARMFYGRKAQEYLFWPVRGTSRVLAATGQRQCFDAAGTPCPCRDTGQDGELRQGIPWPEPRFVREDDLVRDRLTNLAWSRTANLTGQPVSWEGALQAVAGLDAGQDGGPGPWRLPTINELESLVDCSRHTPALPAGHPFTSLQEGYWSATTSFFETDWAWVLYLHKGACGVGHKPGATFHVWPVRAERGG